MTKLDGAGIQPNHGHVATWTRNGVRVALGVMFAMAVAYKLTHFSQFGTVLRSIGPLGELHGSIRWGLGGAIVGIEAFVAALLLAGRHTRLAGRIALLSMVVFTGVTMVFYDSISGGCGCTWHLGGIIPQSGIGLIVRNVVLSGIALVVACGAPRSRQPKSSMHAEPV